MTDTRVSAIDVDDDDGGAGVASMGSSKAGMGA